jgi:hypothetical protein
MKDETVKLLMSKLELVAQKIGVTAEYMFSVYCNQAKVVVITHSIVMITFVVMLIASIVIVTYVTKNGYWASNCDLTLAGGGAIAIIIITLVLGIYSISELGKVITCICNPEFYALKELFRSIK